MVDYIAIMQDYKNRGKSDERLLLTDTPTSINLTDDAVINVKYDAKAMCWIASRASKITYPTARQVIKQLRENYTKKGLTRIEMLKLYRIKVMQKQKKLNGKEGRRE